MKIVVVGLGYVGLPLALQFSRTGSGPTGELACTPRVIDTRKSPRTHLGAAITPDMNPRWWHA